MNLNGSIKIYRKELDWTKELSDPEYRMYILYRKMAGWDEKNVRTFGLIKLSLKEIQTYLPWCIGKVSMTRRSLLEKGFLYWRGDGIGIASFKILNSKFRDNGKFIQGSEKNLLKNEASPQQNEIRHTKNIASQVNKTPSNIDSFSTQPHQNEPDGDLKETLKKEETKEVINLIKERIREDLKIIKPPSLE